MDELHDYPKNTRVHTEEQVAEVAASITEFGFTNPVLIDEDGTIIAGHCRTRAARRLGWEAVPAIRLKHLTEQQRAALSIADNKMALNAMWDEELLRQEIDRLLDEDYDLALTGFSQAEYEALTVEYDALEPSDIDEKLNDMAGNVPRGIQVEFSEERYEEGKAAFAALRAKNPLVGNAILDALKAS